MQLLVFGAKTLTVHPVLTVPDTVTRSFVERYGTVEAPVAVAAVVSLATTLAAAWGLTLNTVLEGGVRSFCVLATDTSGCPCVLKVPLDPASGYQEVTVLRSWEATGRVPAVVEYDRDTGAYLLSWVGPGVDPPCPVREFAALVRDVHGTGAADSPEVAKMDLPTLAESVADRLLWASARHDSGGFHPGGPALIAEARTLADELLAHAGPVVVLHGDTHDRNVLRSASGKMMLIDPMPCRGDVHYDVAFWVSHGVRDTSVEDELDILATELPGLNHQTLRAWVWLCCVLEYRPLFPRVAERAGEYLARHRRPGS